MFSLGCIQSLSCHTDRCPTGVTTQDPARARALVVPHKTERVYNYHRATLHALAELLAAAGLDHPQQVRSIHFSKRSSSTEVLSFAKLYPSLRPGELVDGTSDPRFREAGRWRGRTRFRRRDRLVLRELLLASVSASAISPLPK